MKNEILTLTHATERDVHILLIEELRCSADFVLAVADRAGLPLKPSRVRDVKIRHSDLRLSNRREIHIQLDLMLDQPAGSAIFLIENKLDTTEQPDQAESYQQELYGHWSQKIDAAGLGLLPDLVNMIDGSSQSNNFRT